MEDNEDESNKQNQ